MIKGTSTYYIQRGRVQIHLRVICFSRPESMLQNAFSKARTTTRNARLHHRCPTTLHQRPSFALKWTGVAGHQSAFQSTNPESSQRSYSYLRTYATDSKGARKPSLSHPASRDNAVAVSNDTIYALSTAPGKAGIAIVRISGPSCLDVRFPFPSALSILT